MRAEERKQAEKDEKWVKQHATMEFINPETAQIHVAGVERWRWWSVHYAA